MNKYILIKVTDSTKEIKAIGELKAAVRVGKSVVIFDKNAGDWGWMTSSVKSFSLTSGKFEEYKIETLNSTYILQRVDQNKLH